MTDFSEKQIRMLRGSYTNIGKSVGATREYVIKVLHGRVGNVRGGKKAEAIREKASKMLEILAPAE